MTHVVVAGLNPDDVVNYAILDGIGESADLIVCVSFSVDIGCRALSRRARSGVPSVPIQSVRAACAHHF